MRVVVQRVSEASVSVDNAVVGAIERGVLVYLGVAPGDTASDRQYIAGKIRDLRIFDDETGRMNVSLADVGGSEDTQFRPHPSDRISIFNPMLKLVTALKRKQYKEALALAEEILKAHPEYPEVWERKAMALIGLGRKADAERALTEAFRLAKR